MKTCDKVPGIQRRRRSKLLRPYRHMSSLSILEEKAETSSLIQEVSPFFRRKKHSSLPSYLESPTGGTTPHSEAPGSTIFQAPVEVHRSNRHSFKSLKDSKSQPLLNTYQTFPLVNLTELYIHDDLPRSKKHQSPSTTVQSAKQSPIPAQSLEAQSGIPRRLSFQLSRKKCQCNLRKQSLQYKRTAASVPQLANTTFRSKESPKIPLTTCECPKSRNASLRSLTLPFH